MFTSFMIRPGEVAQGTMCLLHKPDEKDPMKKERRDDSLLSSQYPGDRHRGPWSKLAR